MNKDLLFDRLAQEFLDRFRSGERPRITEYLERHPELADQIREHFPTLILMEDLGPAEPDPPPPAAPKQMGEYRILREVGRGGMGVVYEAEQVSLGRHVALKVLPRHSLSEPTVLERFQREALAAARLHHTNIVPVFAVGEHEGVHFYAMQFLRARPLGEVLNELARLRDSGSRVLRMPGGRESKYFESVARIGVQVAEALAYAHKEGVLHRDIKPSNLLLDTKGDVWITDFGLAQAEGTDDLTRTGDIVGTLQYMAPERFRGMADARSDVYGLGLTLHEMLTLRPAFESTDRARLVAAVMDGGPPPPRRSDPKIPLDLETIVLRATAKDPAHRYPTAAQMAEDLLRFLRGEPIRARRSTAWQRVAKWAKRHPAVAGLIGVSSAAILTLTIGAIWYSARLSSALDETRAQARRSRALALAGASVQAGEHDPMLALLLAREAGRVCMLPLVVSQLHWALQASHERQVLVGHDGEVTFAAFSPRDDRLLTLSAASDVPAWRRDGTARIWTRDGGFVACLRADAPVRSTAWTADGSRIVTTGDDGSRIAWDPDGHRLPGPGEAPVPPDEDFGGLEHPAPLRQAVVSPDGKRILTTCWDRIGRVWSREGDLLALLRGHDDRINSVAFSPDGTRMVTASIDQTARIWDLAGRQTLVLRGHRDEVLHASFSPDGRTVVTASKDGTARLWDLEQRELAVLTGHRDTVTCAAIHGDSIVSGSTDGTAIVWDFDGGREALLEGHTDELRSVCFSPDGQKIATASTDRTARVWDRTGALLLTIAHADPVWTAVFDREGGRIVTASGELLADRAPAARIWDLEGRLLQTLEHDDWVIGATFSHGGDRILTSSTKHAYSWGVDGTRIATLSGHGGWIASVAFSPADDRLLTASFDQTARLWDLEGNELLVLRGHTRPVYCACFSPDGERILTASHDHTLRLWDSSGREQAVLRGHKGPVNAACFDHSGKRILSASDDGTLRLWLARSCDLLALADARISRGFTDAERRRFADLLVGESR